MIKLLRLALLFPAFLITVLLSDTLFLVKEFGWRFSHWCYTAYHLFDHHAGKVWEGYMKELRGYINGKP